MAASCCLVTGVQAYYSLPALAPLAKAELLSLASCGMADPAPGCTDLSETFMSEAVENKSHCPPSLRGSPSPLGLLKSHGINFGVHRKAK